MSFSINTIRKLLDAHLKRVSNLPTHVPENATRTPGIDPWCRSTVMPSTSAVASWGSGVTLRQQGVYQVDLMFPAGQGVEAVSAMADKVIAAFYPGQESLGDEDVPLTLTNVSQLPGYVSDKLTYVVSIRINWFTYVKNE